MKKTTKRAASVLLAAAMCMPAVTSAAAVEGVNYDEYECVKLELNDFEIPAYGNGEFGFCYDSNDYSYNYNSAKLLSLMSGSVTWENSMIGTFTETFDDLAAYAEQHDLYPSVWNNVFYRKDGMDVTVHVGNAEDDVHITPVSTTQPLVTDFTVSDCEMAVGDEDILFPNFSFTLADGTTHRQDDSLFDDYFGEYRNPLELDLGGKRKEELEIGEYTVTARLMDAETTFRLTVKDHLDIADITFDKLVFDEVIDKGTPLGISEIRYTDGRTVKPQRWFDFGWKSVEDYTYRPSKMALPIHFAVTVDDDPWTVGEHSLTIKNYDFSKTYTYRVEPSVIKSIVVDDIVLSEADGTPEYSYGNNGEITLYNHYRNYQPHVTVTFRDGTTEEYAEYRCDRSEANLTVPDYLFVEDDQSAENPWTVGEHTATAYLQSGGGSVAVPFKVIVAESPVKSIAVDDMTVGSESLNYDSWEPVYEIKPDVTVHMADDTTQTLSYGEAYTWQDRDYTVTLSNVVSYREKLNEKAYGTHIVYAHFMGKIVPFKVTVNGLKTICLDSIDDHGDSLTIAYTAQKADGTVCTGSFTADKPERFYECTAHDENLGSVALAYDYAYTLHIGSEWMPLTTGETLTLIGEVGDADGDGTVTIQDATLIQRYLAEFGDADLTRAYYPERFYAADVNSNGKIDIGDVTALQRMLAA